jgi:hypothetical protein
MIIRGFMDRSFSPPAPAVKAFISIEKLKVKGYLKFLLDTGASTTAILDRDRELLGIRIDGLEKAPTRIDRSMTLSPRIGGQALLIAARARGD